mgnify:CR=1 FL=1
MKSRLEDLQAELPIIGDVRGKGLLLAVELVLDRQTMEPLPAAMNAANRCVDLAYERGLIVYARRTRGGSYGDHLMVCPPMISNTGHVDEIIDKLRASLQAFVAEQQDPAGRDA